MKEGYWSQLSHNSTVMDPVDISFKQGILLIGSLINTNWTSFYHDIKPDLVKYIFYLNYFSNSSVTELFIRQSVGELFILWNPKSE